MTPTSDRAREIAGTIVWADEQKTYEIIQAALTAQANEIWEEAAKIAESHTYEDDGNIQWQECCWAIAASIRARKEPKT